MFPLFVGSGVALVTPFNRQGVDTDVLQELVAFHLREGTDALVVNGSTGEAATMSAAEQRAAAEAAVEAAAGRVPVIVGAGGSDTAAVVELARAARAARADAVLVSPPPYNKPPAAGILAHYRAVLDAADLPLVVYNVPSRTACNLAPALIEQLAEDERVVGVKEASGDIAQIVDLARRVGDRLSIYSGNDDQVLPFLALGGQGVISVLANIAPAATTRMVHSFMEGKLDEARELQLDYLPLIRALFSEPNPIPVKAAVAALGFAVGEVRLPLVPPSQACMGELVACMRERGIHPAEAVHA
ncbi:MAG: 4-hydroxy-tetrahydrodipicolinate synthase [Gemmatimonadetes bacterium]|nr:4-hydroxy-tetrahydrodipicolinate synthase [Gemmatimonadota bacterium]